MIIVLIKDKTLTVIRGVRPDNLKVFSAPGPKTTNFWCSLSLNKLYIFIYTYVN